MKEQFSNLLAEIYKDYASKCGVAPDDRDIKVLSRRCRQEGYSFVSITLPRMGADLFLALERGFIASTDFAWFKKAGKCPRLFGVFFKQLFDDDGRLLPEASAVAAAALRQLTFTYKKVKERCSEGRINKALDNFVEVEREIGCSTETPGDWKLLFEKVSHILWGGLSNFNSFDLIPKHGPGAVAEGVKSCFKHLQLLKSWPLRVDRYFPSDSMVIPNLNYLDRLEILTELEPDQERPVRVISVPKTATKPRIIAIEPAAMQFVQQAIKKFLYEYLEKDNWFTAGHVNFTDQTVNQRLALSSSITREYATIDMSDASDRITYNQVSDMLSSVPNFRDAVFSCRSTSADVNGKVINLSKFASMGSALCFPIMSMYFYTVCICALLKENLSPSPLDVHKASRGIYIYGDDIIVPVEVTPDVMTALTAFGGKVSKSKSYWKGFFRESCGCDAYKGEDITPVYMRKHIPSSRRSGDWESVVSSTNQFFERGLWRTTKWLQDRVVEKLGPIPVADDQFPGYAFTSFCGIPEHLGLPDKFRRYNPHLQCWMYYCPYTEIKRQQIAPEGDGITRLFDRLLEFAARDDQEDINPFEPPLLSEYGVVNHSAHGTQKRQWRITHLGSPTG